MTNLQNVLSSVNALTLEEKRALNRALVEMINTEVRVASAVKSAQFNIGDVVTFYKSGHGRHAGTHYVKVMGFNRARTSIVGPEVDKNGNEIGFGPRWTVACTQVSVVKKAA